MASHDERERQERDEDEYQRGWREGWRLANERQTVYQDLSTSHGVGIWDGSNAASRGEPNRYPIAQSVFFNKDRNVVARALDRILVHPECGDPTMWTIGEGTHRDNPGYTINYNWDMDYAAFDKWMNIARGDATD